MTLLQVHVPQIEYIDEVVDVPVQKHRQGGSMADRCKLLTKFCRGFGRQVPVPVKQQKHVEAACTVKYTSNMA